MKEKCWVIVWLFTIALLGCTTTGPQTVHSPSNTISMNIVKAVVDKRCHNELNANHIYQTASMLMSKGQKASLENKICDCVSKQASKSVTLTELGHAAIDSQARMQVIDTVASRSLNVCVSDFLKGI